MESDSQIKYKIGIIGCGLIGNKRAEALQKFSNSKIVMVSDIDKEKARQFSQQTDHKSAEFDDKWDKYTDYNNYDGEKNYSLPPPLERGNILSSDLKSNASGI